MMTMKGRTYAHAEEGWLSSAQFGIRRGLDSSLKLMQHLFATCNLTTPVCCKQLKFKPLLIEVFLGRAGSTGSFWFALTSANSGVTVVENGILAGELSLYQGSEGNKL